MSIEEMFEYIEDPVITSKIDQLLELKYKLMSQRSRLDDKIDEIELLVIQLQSPKLQYVIDKTNEFIRENRDFIKKINSDIIE